jgi:hypothetical protein
LLTHRICCNGDCLCASLLAKTEWLRHGELSTLSLDGGGPSEGDVPEMW